MQAEIHLTQRLNDSQASPSPHVSHQIGPQIGPRLGTTLEVVQFGTLSTAHPSTRCNVRVGRWSCADCLSAATGLCTGELSLASQLPTTLDEPNTVAIVIAFTIAFTVAFTYSVASACARADSTTGFDRATSSDRLLHHALAGGFVVVVAIGLGMRCSGSPVDVGTEA